MSASYVWRVSWYSYKTHKNHYKAFTNKQQALLFMTKLKSNRDNSSATIEKWFG